MKLYLKLTSFKINILTIIITHLYSITVNYMDTSAAQTAVNLALSGKWIEAIEANLEILRVCPDDTDALCRLARAYMETGKAAKAKECIENVLHIDPFNQIAIKFHNRLKLAKNSNTSSSASCNESFLEEPGKTKIIKLLNLGDTENYIHLDPGEEVKLIPYPHRVSINTLNGKYIGRLPDDIAARLKYLIKKGNKYQVLVKSVDSKDVAVFIRETEQGKGVDGSPSFPPEKIEYISFTPPELVHNDLPDTSTTEEDTV